METEAEKSEHVTTSEAENCHSLQPGMVRNSTRTEDVEVAQSIEKGIMNHNTEPKVGNPESDNFLESPSYASKASEETSKDATDNEDKPKPIMIKSRDDQTNETVEAICDNVKYDEMEASGKQVLKEMSLDNATENEVGFANASSLSKSDDENGKILTVVPITFLSNDLNLPEGLNEGGDDAVMDEMKLNNAAPFDPKQGPVVEYVQSGDIIHHDHVGNSTTLSEDRGGKETCPNQSTEEDTALISIQKGDAEGHKSDDDPEFKCKEEENMVDDMEVDHNKAEVVECHLDTHNIYITEEPKQSSFQEEELECKAKSSTPVGMVKDPETISHIEGGRYEMGGVETETEETSLQKSKAEEICSPDITSNHLLDQITVKPVDSQKQRNDENATIPENKEKDISDTTEGVDRKYEQVSEQLEKDKSKVEHDDVKEVSPVMKHEDLDIQINEADDNMDETSIVQDVFHGGQIIEARKEVNDIKEVDCTAKDPITITTGELPGNESSKEDTEVQNRGEVTEGVERADADKDTGKPIAEEDVIPGNFTPVIDEEAILHDHEEDKVTGEIERADANKDAGVSIKEENVGPDNFRTVIEEEDKVQVTEGLERVDADKGTEETIIKEDFVPDHSRTVIDEEAINHGHAEDRVQVLEGMNIVGPDLDKQESVIEEDVHAENSTTTIARKPIQGGHDEDKVIEGLEISNVEKEIQESNVAANAVVDPSTITNAEEPTIYGHDNKVIEGSEKPDAENAITEDVPRHSTPIISEEPTKDGQQEKEVMGVAAADKDIGETITREEDLDYSTTTTEKEPIFHDEDKVIEKLEIDVADKNTGECFIEGVVPHHSTTTTSIGDEPTKDGHDKDKIVDGSETVGTDKDIKDAVIENDVGLDHSTTTTEEKSINDGREEDKITAGLAIAKADKGIGEPVIEEDVIQDQYTPTIGEEPTKEGHEKEKVIEESKFEANKNIEEPTIEENDHSTTTILEKTTRDAHENDKAVEDAIIEDVVMDYPKKAIREEALKDGLEENKVIEGPNIVGADKDIDDPLIVEDDKCDVTATTRENSIKDGHEEDKVVDEVKIVEADNDTSEHVREEEVADNSTTTIMEEPTNDDHEEDEIGLNATEGLEIVHADKDFEVPVIEENVVPYYSTTILGEQTTNDGHEKDKGIEKLEIGGADQTTTTIGEEPVEDDHGENKVAETLESASTHKDIGEHIIEEDVADHSTTTISEEKVIERLEIIGANKNSGEAITDKNVVLDDSTRTTEQEPTKNGEDENKVIQKLEISSADKVIGDLIIEDVPEHSTTTTGEEPVKDGHKENKVIEQIQILGVDKEIGGPVVEENVAPNHSTTVIGEEAIHDGLEEDETIDGLQVDCTDKVNEEVITKEDLAQEHSTTTTQEEPIEDGHGENKVSGAIPVVAEGKSTEKMDEDEIVMDFHENSIGEGKNEKISQEYEVSTELAIGEGSRDAVITKDGSITELSTVSDRKEMTKENSQEEQMEAKKYEGEVKELDLSTETYETPASAQKVETMTPSDEKEQHKNQHADSATNATIGKTNEKDSEDLNDTSTGLNFEEADILVGSSSLIPEVSEEKLNNEILEEKEGTEDGPNSLEEGAKKASLHDADSECRELTESSEEVDRATSINDSENTSKKKQGSIKNLEECIKEEIIDTKLRNHLGDCEIQNQEVVASVGLTSEEQNFKPVSLSERIECLDAENLNKHVDDSTTTHQLHENHAKEVSDIIPANKVHEKDIYSPKKEEQNVESFETSKEPESPQSWQERTVDGEKTLIEQSERESMKLEKSDESDSIEVLEHTDVMDGSHEASAIKEEHSSKIIDTDTVEDKKIVEDDAVHDQSTVPCSYETVNRSLVNDEKEQKNIELEPELEDDYHYTRAIEQGSISKNQNKEVHEELEHTEKEIIQDRIVEEHTANAVEEVIVQENSPKDDKVSKAPEGKVKESDIVFMEATDSERETEILHLKEEAEEGPKKSIDAFGTTEATLKEITKMESNDKPNYRSTESSLSEEQGMVEIPEKTESNNNETIFATPLAEILSLPEAETEGGELVDASNLASAKMIATQNQDVDDVKQKKSSNLDDNRTEDNFTAENSEAAAQEKSYIPVETSSIVLQSVDRDTETASVEEIAASKPSSVDVLERNPQEPSKLVSTKEELNKIGTQVMEAPLVEQTKREMNTQKEQDIKLEEDPATEIENSEQEISIPESDTEKHISEQKDCDVILKKGNNTELNEFRESSRSETSEPSLKENQPESEESSPKDLETSDARVNIKTDILEQEEDPIKKHDQNFEEIKKEMKVDENVLEVQSTDHNNEINEPCNTTENVTIAKKNLEATDPCEEFTKPTKTVDHDQSHEVLPEIEKTEVVNDGEIIKDQDTVFAEDRTVEQSIEEEEKENDTLDKAGHKVDVNHLMKDTVVNEEVPCGVERPEGDNIEKQSIEEEAAKCVGVLDYKTGDKEVKDSDFTSSDCKEKTEPDVLTCVKELNQSVDSSCDTEASIEEVLEQEEVSNTASEDLGEVVTGTELDIPKMDNTTDTCVKGGDIERMNLDNTPDLISEVHATKNANIDQESVTMGNDVKGIIENDITIKNTEESFEEDQKNVESAIPIENTSAELGEPCKVDSNFVPDKHDESNAEGHDSTVKDGCAVEIFPEKKKEDTIKEVKCESLDDQQSKSNEANADTTIDETLIGKSLEEASGLVPDEMIHETITKPSGNEETTHNDGTDPEQLNEVKEPTNSVLGTMSTEEKLHMEEELPIGNRDVLSLMEASQIQTQEKEGKSNQDETQGVVSDNIEKKEISLPQDRSEEDTEGKAPVEEMPKEAVKKIYELNIQEENSATEEEEAKQPDTPQNFKTLDQPSDVSAEKHMFIEASPLEKSGSGIETPSQPASVTQKSLETAETEEGKHGEAQENVSEVKKVGEEEKRMHSLEEETNIVSKSQEAGFSLHDLLHKSRETTSQTAEQSEEEQNKDTPAVETKDGDEHEEDAEGEDGDEHKKEDSGSDTPVMVEASRDIDAKPTPKKSHNILSGVGSKVKQSISKVKKAITGKSSHPKQSSAK